MKVVLSFYCATRSGDHRRACAFYLELFVELVNQTVSFSWTISQDSGVIQSAITYELQIASDLNFTTIIQTSPATGTSYQQAFATAGVYYWRVRAKDAAGNVGTYSSGNKLTIN